jgi:hypothetical protein
VAAAEDAVGGRSVKGTTRGGLAAAGERRETLSRARQAIKRGMGARAVVDPTREQAVVITTIIITRQPPTSCSTQRARREGCFAFWGVLQVTFRAR